MEYRIGPRTTLVRLARGEELVASLLSLFPLTDYPCAVVSGLGAVGEIETGLFRTAEKRYLSTVRKGDMEIVSLTGTIGRMHSAPYAHLHLAAANEKGEVAGGHLNRAVVSATAEIVLIRSEHAPDRRFSEEIGLNLWNFESSNNLQNGDPK